MAKKGAAGKAASSLRRADADMKRDKKVAKARAAVEKRRRQLGEATSALAALQAAGDPPRVPNAVANPAVAKPALARSPAPSAVPGGSAAKVSARIRTATGRVAAKVTRTPVAKAGPVGRSAKGTKATNTKAKASKP